MLPESYSDQLKEVVACLNTLLGRSPADAHADLYLVERQVAQLRDSLIFAGRQSPSQPETRHALQQVNAVLSLIVGCEYPGGKVQWKLLTQAKDTLQQMQTQP